MKAFVVLAAVVACASANPGLVLNGLTLAAAPAPAIYSTPLIHHAPITYAAPAIVAPAVTKTQYHAQDELGQASYGHAEPGQAHAAVRDAFGNVAGSYAYINPEGKEVRVSYIADGAGFRVASNDLPVAPAVPEAPKLEAPKPVEDTPEVAAAKAAHAAAIAKAKSGEAPVVTAAGPQPVQDTADVAAAKAEHQKAVEEARARNAAAPQSRRKRSPGLLAATPLVYSSPVAAAPIVYSSPVVAAAPIVAAPAVREATLTKVINTPGHAVSYRVD